MNNPLHGKVCEICGAPATLAVADSQEVEPVPDEKAVGGMRAQLRVTSRHLFCEAHKRRARRTLMNGQVMEGAPV